MEKKRTVGEVSAELLQRDVHGDVTAGEQMRESLSEYERFLLECVDLGKAKHPDDFYVVVHITREQVAANVLRNRFFHTHACPTPTWDQVVYKYHRKDERIEFLWSIPCKEACEDLKAHALDLDPAFNELLQFVLDFSDGTLDKKAMALNGEIFVNP